MSDEDAIPLSSNTPVAGERKYADPIAQYATNRAFAEIYDSCAIGKVKLQVQVNEGKKGRAFCYLNLGQFRLLAHAILQGQISRVFKQPQGDTSGQVWRFETYGGGGHVAEYGGKPEARHMKIEYQRNDPSKAPFTVLAERGPGKSMGKGAVQPDGPAVHSAFMPVPEAEMMRLMLEALAFVDRYELIRMSGEMGAEIREAAAQERRRQEAS